jgi:aldehyde dehydrogenase (NAD+)
MSDLATLRDELRESFKDKALASYGKRVSVLKAVRTAINVNYDAAVAALKKDLKRDDSVSRGEINTCLTEIDVQLATLARWMQPEPKSTHMLMTPGHTEVRREPYGVVLVIGPFNYPMNLCLAPAIGALAAGNCVVLKPSEQSTATERWFLNNFAPMVDRSVFRVVAADVARTTALLTLQWDFIFFTGSTFVGRIVSRAAAEHLTPTVMELGGKAPVIVDKSTVHVGEAARRVAWGKWINGGQTCMAPDYVLCHRSKHAEFTAKLTAAQEDFFGKDPSASEDYCRMCTLHHSTRALELIEKSTQDDGAKVLCGGAKVCDVAAK